MIEAEVRLTDIVDIERERDAMTQALRIVIRTKPIQAIRYPYRKITRIPSYWTKSKWAKVIKWMLGRKWLGKLVPYPIKCLVFAEDITYGIVTLDLDENTLSYVQVQIAGVIHRGDRPSLIVIGHKSWHNLMKATNFNLLFSYERSGMDPIDTTLMGIPCKLVSNLEGVLVLGSKEY